MPPTTEKVLQVRQIEATIMLNGNNLPAAVGAEFDRMGLGKHQGHSLD
jgi:hypothetical protein